MSRTATTNGAALGGALTADAAPVAVLSAKLAPPPLAHATVLRKRPLALLSRAVQRLPLTLISGPAGSGKTVLAACWMEAQAPGRPIAWLTLDDYDDEPSVYWSYVVAALDRAGVALSGVPRLVRGESPPRGLLSALAAAITARSQPIVLIIDNADHVSSRGIITALDLLMRHAGSKLRLVLCARADPQLPLHQYRLAGSMAEIRGDQLAFTAEETRDLMAATGAPVTAEVAARLCAETQGWAVGLRLAAAPVKQGASPERLATSLAHDDGTVAQYLFAEVLAGQPAGVRRLLLRISVAEELEADLVDRLAGRPGSRRVLVALARANAFVEESPGAPGGFRIHPLFREMLQAQLAYDHPGEVAGVHRTCAAWYAEAGRIPEAIEHAITARDWAFASCLLVDDLVVPRLLAHGDDPLLRSRPLPPGLGGTDAAVLRAAVAVAAGDAPSPADLSTAAAAVRAGDRPSLRASAALTCVAAATLARSDPAHLLALADAAQAAWVAPGEEDHPEHREVSALVAGARAQAIVRGDEAAQEVATHLRVAAGAAHVAGAGRLRSRAVALLALLESFDGQLTRAAQHATEAEALCADAGTDEHDRLVASAAALAWVHLQRYALSDAQEWLTRAQSRERHGPAGPEGGLGSALVVLVQAQSLRVRRQYDAAEDCLHTVLEEPGLPRWLRERAVLESAWLAFAQGRSAEGVALLDDAGVDGDRPTPLRALAGLLGGDGAVALLAAEEPGGAPADALEHRIVRACQLAEAGTVPAAVAELERALEVGRRELHRLPFLEAPPQGRRLLRMHPRLQEASRWLSPSSAAAPQPRAAAAEPVTPVAQQLTQDLSDRETEVLQHLAQMLSTAEIAATMFISVNTVRTHIRSILRKLGVSRRNQAVRRAREHGLL